LDSLSRFSCGGKRGNRGMMQIAVVGAGGWGMQHIKSLFQNKGVTVSGFIDINPQALKGLLKEYGVNKDQCFSSVEKALRESPFDAAIVSVPNPDRIPLVEYLLRNHIPCLIDKPAAHSAKDLRSLARTVRQTGAKVMVAQNYRFLRQAQYIRQLIAGGKAGRVRHISHFFSRNESFLAKGFYARLSGPGVIALELGCHHIDLFNYFIGAFPVSVQGKTWHEHDDAIKADCHLSALLTYPGNVSVTYSSTLMGRANRTSWPGRFEISCERAHIVWDEQETDPIRVFEPDGTCRVRDKYKTIRLPTYPGDSLSRCQEAFFGLIQGKDPPEALPCLVEQNAACVLAGLAIHESGKTGKLIDFGRYYQKEFGRYASL